MKPAFSKVYILLAGLIACVQWSQIAHRLALFYYDYNSERGFNHVDNGVIGLAYIVDAVFFCIGLFVIHLVWKRSGFWRASAMALVLANLIGGLTLFNMHRTGILVEYHEFIRNWKNSGQNAHQEDESSWITCKQAEGVALNFLTNKGYTNVHFNVEWEEGRFAKYESRFTLNDTNNPIKVIVDRKTSLVGYDYSHW